MVYIVTSRCGGSLKIVTISFRWWWFAPEVGFLFWKCATLRGDREAKGPLWGHKISWTHISHRINISVYYNPQNQLFVQYCHESTYILNIFGYFLFCDSVNFVMYFFMFRYILFNVFYLSWFYLFHGKSPYNQLVGENTTSKDTYDGKST